MSTRIVLATAFMRDWDVGTNAPSAIHCISRATAVDSSDQPKQVQYIPIHTHNRMIQMRLEHPFGDGRRIFHAKGRNISQSLTRGLSIERKDLVLESARELHL